MVAVGRERRRLSTKKTSSRRRRGRSIKRPFRDHFATTWSFSGRAADHYETTSSLSGRAADHFTTTWSLSGRATESFAKSNESNSKQPPTSTFTIPLVIAKRKQTELEKSWEDCSSMRIPL